MERFRVFKLLSMLYYQWMVFDIKMKLLIGFTVMYYLFEGLLPISVTFNTYQYKWYIISVPIIVLLLFSKKLVKLLRYHGAEHKVINCYIKHGRINEDLVINSSRFNKRCGTNLVAVFIIFYSGMLILGIDSILLMVVLFIIAILLNKKLIQIKNERWDKYINFFQIITVWEPQLEEIRTAIICFNKLHRAHQIYQHETLKRSGC